MRVLMVGTPVCTKCRAIAPKLESYCKEKSILYRYEQLSYLSNEERQLLIDNNVRQAPAFIIYLDDKIVVISGDDLMLKLDTIYKNS